MICGNTISFIDITSKILPAIIGVGLLIIAGLSFKFYSLKSVHEQWLSSFREVYSVFWHAEKTSRVRIWITSDKEYHSVLKPILHARMKNSENFLASYEDNKKLDDLDVFLSIIARIDFLGTLTATAQQRVMYDRLYNEYWIIKIKEREELMLYIKKYWNGLID